jgi:uncharacterized protein YlaI
MQKKTITTKKHKKDDPCPICDKELYIDHEYTQRIGLLDDLDEVTGWMCPHCKSEFDADNHLTKFMGKPGLRGEA